MTEEQRNYKKQHYLLSHDKKRVWCIHCGKIVEERESLPDYLMFIGGVLIKQNLLCTEGNDEPYTEEPKKK